MDMILNPLFYLITLALVLFFVTAMFAPFEALGWWAGWSKNEVESESINKLTSTPVDAAEEADWYLFYLTGIGGFSKDYLAEREGNFVKYLGERLPGKAVVARDVFPFSVSNNPLNGERFLTRMWNWIHNKQLKNPNNVFVFFVVIRNLFQVAISSDPRYGPINNLGVAQEVSRSLLEKGYRPGSGKPIYLLGYSGGAQVSAGITRYLHKTLEAPVYIFTMGGVISDDPGLDDMEHLYQLIGGQDFFPKVGAAAFPGRWPILPYSHWNKAKSQGRISAINAGENVIHTGPTDYFSETATLPDGQTHMDHTVQIVTDIITGDYITKGTVQDLMDNLGPKNNYENYQRLPFIHPAYYPVKQTVPPELYRPIFTWMGRMILPEPEQRPTVRGTLFEVYHTDEAHRHLVGQVINLRYSEDPTVQKRVWSVTKDVYFNRKVEESKLTGLVHPDRLNRWHLVNPLESIAGARPNDDVIVGLHEPIEIEEGETTSLYITHEPVQISGRYYGLVQFIGPTTPDGEEFQVVHFNRDTGQFDGVKETVCLPHVLPTMFKLAPSTSHNLEKSPLNSEGWYIYGAQNDDGIFVVQSLAPRELLRLQPEQVVLGKKETIRYLKKGVWGKEATQKGRVSSVLLDPNRQDGAEAVANWREGDQALIASVYGGITGRTPEPYAVMGKYYFGHFSYGTARVVREPLADELRFEIEYHQVYTNNIDGLISGALHWSRYLGDRQWGFAGFRPISDIVLKLDSFTEPYDLPTMRRSPLEAVVNTLELMTARYRIGDGTGGTYVGPANNCSQDSNQALYATIKRVDDLYRTRPDFQMMLKQNPDEEDRLEELIKLGKRLRGKLMPFGSARADWEYHLENLGSNLEDGMVANLWRGVFSWRTILPAYAAYTIARVFVEQGASAWVLRTNQIGGDEPNIEPLPPFPY